MIYSVYYLYFKVIHISYQQELWPGGIARLPSYQEVGGSNPRKFCEFQGRLEKLEAFPINLIIYEKKTSNNA